MITLIQSLSVLTICVSSFYCSSIFAQSSVVRLDTELNAATEKALIAEGVKVLHYYGNQTYLLSRLPSSVKAKAIELPQDGMRLEKAVESFADAMLQLDLILAYSGAAVELGDVLAKAGFEVDAEQVEGGISLSGRVHKNQLQALLRHPLILNATPKMEAVIPYNLEGRIAQSVTPLNSGIVGAPNLNGAGVVLGIGDGGKLSGHPDIGDRVIHTTSYYNSAWGSHPDMVAGIMSGSGSINPRHQGVAREAELVIEASSGIVYFAPSHLAQYQMSITNNSYGPSFHCATANKYYGVSASVDQQLFDNPSLLHIYAVGNSGSYSCNGLPVGYGNIPGGAQNAKNSLSVGNVHFDRTRYSGSSAGPTYDGRLKPEIMAVGRSVTSNNRSAGYSGGTGTSYAAPGVAATLGLLTQRYKEQSGGVLPDGALLKAIACNTAEDIGPHGPDFQHGFGLINGVKALAAIDDATYHQGYLSTGGQYVKTISAVSGIERIKFLLYWPDQAGSTTNESSALVNQFDLKVVSPLGDTIRPWVLDPQNPGSLAIRAIDTLNNIEQVTLDAPVVGDYKVIIEGIHLPYGATDFILTWDLQLPEVKITCPYGGESLTPGTDMYIGWNASPGQTGPWKVEYSIDGNTWNLVAQGINTADRYLVWSPPMSNTDIQFKVTNETSLLSDLTNEPAFLLGVPQNVSGEAMCDGSVTLSWSSVQGAASYQVYKFDGAEMLLAATTTDTFQNLGGLMVGIDSLFTVEALAPSGKTSQRAYAIAEKSELNGPSCNAPLPVQWLSVRANQLANGIEVEWTVASEHNNQYFEVQRSAAGRSWITIGKRNGRGTDPTTKTYSFLDVEQLASSTVYYRIKQVDQDGASSFSDILAFAGSEKETPLTQPVVTLIENPVNELIRLTSEDSNTLEGTISDLSGRAVQHFWVANGLNNIPISSSLKAGLYVLRVNTTSGVETLKVIRK